MKDLLIAAIDDESEILDIYKSSLKAKSRIETFSDPIHFIESLTSKRIRPDIVITDYSMPKMNGVDLLRAAKGLGADFSSILISGYLDKATVIAAANIGRVLVLEKPAPRHSIMAAIDSYILEAEFSALKSTRDVTSKKLRELFDMFRILCLDELDLQITSKTQLIPASKKEKALSLDHAIYKLEDQLEELSKAEQEVFKKMVQLKNTLIAA